MRISKFLFCLLAISFMLTGCSKDNKIASTIMGTNEIERLEPAAGHFMMDYIPTDDQMVGMQKIKLNLPEAIAEPMWIRNAATYERNQTVRPKIIVVIDDMGVAQDRSMRAAELPGPLTLSYLPYAANLPMQTALAHANGHELMVHMPMQPLSDAADPGPNALETNLTKQELLNRIRTNLSAFEGYVGVNNHMGSAFTQDQTGLKVLMSELRSRDIMYLDSRTSPTSIAEQTARQYNVATTGRDVFIDHVISEDFIKAALRRIEDYAMKEGSAIAIGHPHELTINALREWLPTLERKGFDLVPITAVMIERDPRISDVSFSTATFNY